MNPAYGAPQPADPGGAMSMQRSRFFDLLDQLRSEYEALVEDNRNYHGIREEYQRKVEKQVAELTIIEQSLAELDRKHLSMKEQYDAELSRLQAATGATGGAGGGQVPSVGAPGHDQNTASSAGHGDLANRGRGIGPGGLIDPSSGVHGGLQAPGQKNPGNAPGGLVRDSVAVGHDVGNSANGHANVGLGGSAGAMPKRLVQLPSSVHGFGPHPSNPGGGFPTGPNQTSPPLVGIASLPSATHTPALPPVAPSGPRLLSAIDAGVIKKDPSMPLGGPASGQQMMSGDMVAVPAGIAPGAQTGDEDYVVFHGRSPNGSLVNMKVSLQSSLPHDSVVCCVRYSWDGDYLATGSNRSAHIFDVNSGQRVAVFSKDDGTEVDDGSAADSYVRAVCFSRDGRWLITGAEDHVVKVWDVRNRTVKHKLVGHDTDIYSVDASANGAFIISGSGDKKAKIWSLESGKLLSTLGGEYGPTDGITSVSISPTSQHVAAGSLDKTVRVWDVESSRLVRQFEGHRDSVYSVAFSPDGLLLLSGSLDKTLKLWDLSASRQADQCRLTFTGHKDFVLSVCFSPDGRWLISGSKDRTVQFWDPRQATMCVMLQGHKNSVISIAHNPASMSLATGSGDCRARVWNFGPP